MTAIYNPIDTDADDPADDTLTELLRHLRDRPGITTDAAHDLWWFGPPTETCPIALKDLAQHSNDLCILDDLLLAVCTTIEQGAPIGPDRVTALRRACAGLPCELSDVPDEPLIRELAATANVARALTGCIGSGRPVPRYTAVLIGELVQLAGHP